MSNIRRFVYALYKADWILTNIGRPILAATYAEYCKAILSEDIDSDLSFEDYLEEFGFNGGIYACYEEFLANEYRDREYMANLLGEDSKEFEAWKNDTSAEAFL